MLNATEEKAHLFSRLGYICHPFSDKGEDEALVTDSKFDTITSSSKPEL